MPEQLSLATQERLNLEVLKAHQGKMPWGITDAGWDEFVHNISKKVRDAALKHPACPEKYRYYVATAKVPESA